MINVTQPFLPPKKNYQKYIDEIWQRNWLTNNGPLVNELELNLKKSLKLSHLLYVSNGTIALQLAIKALDLKGEVITTPFSYVATTSSIVWENCTPIFVDIDKNTLNINPKLIEQAITKKTSAIIATHVFGIPCDIDAIDIIAKKYNLNVIYDAAHCFGTDYKGQSVLNYGDISCISFHATKLFHTIEGGAVVTQSPELLEKLACLRNFGHDGAYNFNGVGINGKNSEFHAAMGLCNLNYIDKIITKRKQDSLLYDNHLTSLNCQRPTINLLCDYNYAYYPIIFNSETDCLAVLDSLNRKNIFARRYFYPSLSTLDYVPKNQCNISEDIAARILCLPLYYDLSQSEIGMICRYIKRYFQYKP